MHYYNFNPSDFNAKTRHLTHLERAFYRDLIDLYYTTEKPITADLPKLERLLIAKSDDEKQALAMVLDEFFVLKNGAYHDFEMTAKIRAYKWTEKKRNTKGTERNVSGTENGTDKEHIGTLSGTEKERKQRHKNKVIFLRALLSDNGVQTTANASIKALTTLCNEHKIFINWDEVERQAQHSGTENGTDKEHIGTPKSERITNNHKPLTINHKPINNISPLTPQGEVSEHEQTQNLETTTTSQTPNTSHAKKPSKPLNISFDEFWDMYDKKQDRPKCERLWSKLTDQERLDIMAYLPKYKQSQPDKKYRKHPQTFLNNRSWENEIIDSTSKPTWQPPQPPSRMDELRHMAMTNPTNIYVNDLPDFDNSANSTNFIGVSYE